MNRKGVALLCVIQLLCILLFSAGCTPKTPVWRTPTKPDYTRMEPIGEDAGIVEVARNGRLSLSLQFNPINIIVKDQETGSVWAASPMDADTDPNVTEDMKAFLKSQLVFSYIVNRNRRSMDSFTECDETGQVNAWKISNGVRLEYVFGDMGIGEADIPMKLTAARADALFLQNPKIGEEGAELFRSCYTWDQERSVWDYGEYNFGEKVNELFHLFEKIGYSGEDLMADAAAFGETAEVRERIGFTVPVEYTLDAKGLSVRVPVNEIAYPPDYPILDMTVNGYFGAASGGAEEGYIFVPDGCGALMSFSNISLVRSEVLFHIYGRDFSIGSTGTHTRTQPVLLPVFGLKDGNNAFFAVIERGDAIASLQVTPAGFNSSYNSIAPSFILHARDNMYLGVGDSNNEVTVIQNEVFDGDIQIRYAFLYGEKANYAGMAEWYRSYLSEKGYTDHREHGTSPLLLETVGAVSARQSFLGINYQGIEPLTTFAQTQDILDDLKARGVSRPVLRLSGWMNGGAEQRPPKSMTIIGRLGGKNGLLSLVKNYSDVFPGVRMLSSPTSAGISLTSQVARRIDEQYVRTYRYNIDTDKFDPDAYIISPSYYGRLADSFLKQYHKLQIPMLCLEDMGNGVYADYSKSRNIDRQKALEAVVSVLETLKSYELMLPEANVHTARFASYIPEAPMDSSHYFSLDDGVPFYQMVIGAFTTISGPALNLSSQNEMDFLKTVLYGGVPSYKIIAASADNVIRSDSQDLYSAVYADWADTITAQYKRAAAVLAPVSNAHITGFHSPRKGVYCAIYSNGKTVSVNLTEENAVIGGLIIPKMDMVCY